MTKRHPLVSAMASGIAYASLLWAHGTSAQTREEAPVRRVAFTVDRSSRQEFFDRLGSFASKASFEFRVMPTRPGEEYFLVSLWRKDLDILASNALNPGVFNLYFYAHSPRKMTEAQINTLVTQIKEAVAFPGSAQLAP